MTPSIGNTKVFRLEPLAHAGTYHLVVILHYDFPSQSVVIFYRTFLMHSSDDIYVPVQHKQLPNHPLTVLMK